MTTDLSQSFLDMLPTASSKQLNAMIEAAQLELEKRKPQICDLVTYLPDFCKDEEILTTLRQEGSSMGLTPGRKVSTKYLNTSGKPYIYPDTNPVHEASDITQYPGICQLGNLVNASTLVNGPLPTCLTMLYSGPDSALSLHADDEESINQAKAIATFSIGRTRIIEFFTKAAKPRKVAEFKMEEGGLLIMKPGTQKHFLHMVRAETEEITSSQSGQPQERLVFSFRDEMETKSTTVTPNELPRSRSCELKDGLSEKATAPAECITLIAGDSFAERLDVGRLSKSKKKVINIAKGGSRIKHTENSIKKYVTENPNVEIEKIIISVGTNDIRHCPEGVGHLKGPLKYLAKTIKELSPKSKVYFQSLIPLPLLNNKHAPQIVSNILYFNKIVRNLCVYERFYYINVFNQLLDHRGQFRNDSLFKKNGDIHLNDRGMGILARHYIVAIHSNWFNPSVYQ